jgi:hypothetical protein
VQHYYSREQEEQGVVQEEEFLCGVERRHWDEAGQTETLFHQR